jgi:hypothetical protein
VIRIDVLPDDVLLEIFDFYMVMTRDPTDIEDRTDWKTMIEAWQLLVHVCRRWRSVVFGSPRRLNLQLYCTAETPARDTLPRPWDVYNDIIMESAEYDCPTDAGLNIASMIPKLEAEVT